MKQTIRITSPLADATIEGVVTVQVVASNVVRVSFSVDGKTVGTDSSAPFSWTLDTTKLADGSHTIKAISSNGKVSESVNVVVANAHLTAAFTAKEI